VHARLDQVQQHLDGPPVQPAVQHLVDLQQQEKEEQEQEEQEEKAKYRDKNT
jgi:hypothetical protein